MLRVLVLWLRISCCPQGSARSGGGNCCPEFEAAVQLETLQVLRLPLFQLPQLITQLVNAQVSIKRIEEFLAAPKSDPLEQLPAAAAGRSPLNCWLLECCSACLTFSCDIIFKCGSITAVLSMRCHLQPSCTHMPAVQRSLAAPWHVRDDLTALFPPFQ